MESIDFKNFIENDSNPFILFDFGGHIKYLNNSAEVLLGYINPKILYDLALEYAPKSYGHRGILSNLEFDIFSFFSIMVGYEDDENIYIRLYNKPQIKQEKNVSKEMLILTDVNSLLEANITLFEMQSSAKLSLFVDQDLPMFKIDQNSFSKILRKMLEAFIKSQSLSIDLKLLFGEYIVLGDTKYQMLELILKSQKRDTSNDDEIMQIIEQTCLTCQIKKDTFKLQMPIIL
ncbi:conserved hypothetical protein [Sulfurovum sp. enrichment culture clone C5]|uniref:PAS domain-containing protein n=1 Tax=Sulfurovum sp. enrichment culture clone C5 TaxID=497650 RepID=A0A0S4XQB7_9BACT|nr:conserved hypothetical protein [Sulfurovum sp. enrichment culture clone C5]